MKARYYILFISYGFIKIWEFFLYCLGIKKNSLRILLYHNIKPEDYLNFESNLLWLQSRWRFVTPLEFEQHISGERILFGKCLMLTFDDGFKSNRVVAEKILENLGIKAIFFVVTKYIDQNNAVQSRKFYAKNIMPGIRIHDIDESIMNMNWDDLRWLSSHGHAIGAHTINHRRLSEVLNESELSNEIVSSGNLIESILGIKTKHFAYTFGDINSFSLKALQYASVRYRYVYSGLRGNNWSNVDSKSIRRDAIYPSSSNLLLDLFLSGSADFLYRKSRLKLDRWSENMKSND